MSNYEPETIADILTPEGKKKFKKGDLIGFKQSDGSTHNYKFVRVNKRKDIFMVQRVEVMTPEEAENYMIENNLVPTRKK
jgi:hypothetical protein